MTVSDRLFHGTNEASVPLIIQQGLDPLRAHTAQVNGAQYGKGTYLARDSIMSHKFSPTNHNGERFMFVCRVLIGRVWYDTPCTPVPFLSSAFVYLFLFRCSFICFRLTGV